MWRRKRTTESAQPETTAYSEDDLAIVARALVDLGEFDPLYRKHLATVLRRCQWRLGDPEEAWDAAGITFAKALTALPSYRSGSFEGWLIRIADNTCKDIRKHKARHPQIPIVPEFDFLDDEPDPEAQAIAAMNREALDRALSQLLPRREQIVRLHLDGLSGKEIAARLGVSYDVVRQQQTKAYRQLADLLKIDRDGREGRNG